MWEIDSLMFITTDKNSWFVSIDEIVGLVSFDTRRASLEGTLSSGIWWPAEYRSDALTFAHSIPAILAIMFQLYGMHFHQVFLWQAPFISNIILTNFSNIDYPHHIFLFSLLSFIFNISHYNIIYLLVYLLTSLPLHQNMCSLWAYTLVYCPLPRRAMKQRNAGCRK